MQKAKVEYRMCNYSVPSP